MSALDTVFQIYLGPSKGQATILPHKTLDSAEYNPAVGRLLDRRDAFSLLSRICGWIPVPAVVPGCGFKIVLSPDVPKIVNEHLRGNVETFLADNGLTMDRICSYIFHSGGPKVLEAMETALNLPPNALAPSWKSLREVGNLSAASVLAVMEDYLLTHPGTPGCYSIIAAMGPAFCSELVLLQW